MYYRKLATALSFVLTIVGPVAAALHAQPPSPWTPLKNLAQDSAGNPINPGTMLLLSDGSVLVNGPYNCPGKGLAHCQPQEWLRLVPDYTGSYINGSWMSVPPSICPHGDYASQVMSDGRVFIAGGEYPGLNGGTYPGPDFVPNGCNGLVDTEIYDVSKPPAQAWTKANPPATLIDPTQPPPFSSPAVNNQGFLDMISETLPNGSVLMAPVVPKQCGDTLIYSPHTGWFRNALPLANTGSPGVTSSSVCTGGANQSSYGCSQQEATWVKLQDGSILSVDPPAPPACSGSPQQNPQTSERFFPSQNRWVAQAPLGFALFDTEFGWSGGGETGPAFLLSSGKAAFIGGAPVMGVYDPAANTWNQSAIAPNGPATGGQPLGGPDVPGTIMANGKILLTLRMAATANNVLPTPVYFYEYDPSQDAYTEVPGPGAPGAPSIWTDCSPTVMLNLPDGTVLMESGCVCSSCSCCSPQLYVYTPNRSPLPQGQPTIQSISAISGNCNTCYHLTGTGLNGISEGASFGDDAQMATDFPLVRLKDGNGNIAYARTYNWSSTRIAAGFPGSTDFQLPQGFGPCELQTVANGNPSAWTSFTNGCVLPPPVVIPLCPDPPCDSGSAIVWTRPPLPPLGDPWVDGTVLTLVGPGPLASDLADRVQVSIDTQAFMGQESDRRILTELGASARRSALIVGPLVELRNRGATQAPTPGTNALALAGMISIPFESRGLGPAAKVRIVKFDDRRGRWVDAGPQTIDRSKHAVTAGISGTGKFTVVADI